MKSPRQKQFIELFNLGVYLVTRTGEILSCRNGRHGLTRQYRRLHPAIDSCGYPRVQLVDLKKCKITARVHQLVWLFYKGTFNSALQINHKNGVKEDNRLENLELVTRSENMLHAFRLGIKRNRRGDAHPSSKLTFSQVQEIRRLYADTDITQLQLATKFKVSLTLVNLLLLRKHRDCA